MKIAFVTQPWEQVIPVLGGYTSISILSYQIAQRLVQSGNDLILYGQRRGLQQKMEHDDKGIKYRRFSVDMESRLLKPLRALERLQGHPYPKRPLFASRLYYLGYIFQVARDLRRENCDIIHLHNFSQFVPVIRAFNPRSKIVLQMHCEWLSQLDRSLIEKRLRHVDLVIGCSEYITEKIRQRFPRYASRCRTITGGVDISQFVSGNNHRQTNRDRPKRLLFVGRISPEKGVHVLLDAFQEVAKSYPNVELELVGGEQAVPYEFIVLVADDHKVSELASFYKGLWKRGNYLPFLKEHTPSDLATKVIFSGPVLQSDLVNHYRNADILVNPSFSDAFPLPILEAMACKVPVVGTRVGGMQESVEDGRTGLLVERDSPSELARAILSLFANDDLRRSMGEAGRERVMKQFSWEKIAERLQVEYSRINQDRICM
jgi:glycosyltransferase involved in cell wall biosynthesis